MIRAKRRVKEYCNDRIYLAGDLSGYSWRKQLIDWLPNCEWNTQLVVETDCFNYVGPYFEERINKRSRVEPQTSTANAEQCQLAKGLLGRAEERFINGIQHCTLFFAYVDRIDDYDTMVDIDAALQTDKHVVVCFAPGIDHFKFEKYIAGARFYRSVTIDKLDGLLLIEMAMGKQSGGTK